MTSRNFLKVLLALIVSLVFLVACGTSGDKGNAGQTSTPSSSEPSLSVSLDDDEIVDIEVWGTNNGFKAIEKGSPLYELYADLLGVGVIHPYIEWDGGTNYLNQLNIRIAGNNMPDVFQPEGGKEYELALNDAIVDLTDLLPEYAPKLWEIVPDEVWDVVRSNDPTGQGRIYYVPVVQSYGLTGGIIRKDWLDDLGLPMPKTQEEYVNVLRAFRDNDMNGNGDPNDEFPTGGRAEARWMDHLFNMYGIAMDEGRPDWDIYDGEITYSAVTPNMRDALAFIASLYEEGLLDPETFLNSASDWNGKISSNRVGSYFHFGERVSDHLQNIEQASGIRADFSVLPVLEAPGYEDQGFVTLKKLRKPRWVVKNNEDEKKLMASLKLLNNLADPDIWFDLFYGVEGMHHEVVDGKRVLLPTDGNQQNKVLQPYNDFGSLEFIAELLTETANPENMWMIEQNIRNMKDNQQYVKQIAGDGLPESVYEGYPDIRNRTLYVEYATKIILGQLPIEAFDEFVERWYSSGGEEVTKRVREWYANLD